MVPVAIHVNQISALLVVCVLQVAQMDMASLVNVFRDTLEISVKMVESVTSSKHSIVCRDYMQYSTIQNHSMNG
jgi:SUMO ligase MMS21 Smc5/6 complex component